MAAPMPQNMALKMAGSTLSGSGRLSEPAACAVEKNIVSSRDAVVGFTAYVSPDKRGIKRRAVLAAPGDGRRANDEKHRST